MSDGIYLVSSALVLRASQLAGLKIAGRNSLTSDMLMTPPLWQKVKK